MANQIKNPSNRIDTAGALLKKFTEMKTIPAIATRLIHMLEDENSTFQEFEEVIKMGTMDEVLSQCGWRKVSRPQKHWEPPKRQFITELQQEISIPCPA